MLSKRITGLTGGAVALLPLFAFAQDLSWFETVVEDAYAVVQAAVPLLIGLAVLVFFWGVIRYMTAGEDPEKRKNGRNLMIYGVIAIFVMVALWGLIALLYTFSGVEESATTIYPEV